MFIFVYRPVCTIFKHGENVWIYSACVVQVSLGTVNHTFDGCIAVLLARNSIRG